MVHLFTSSYDIFGLIVVPDVCTDRVLSWDRITNSSVLTTSDTHHKTHVMWLNVGLNRVFITLLVITLDDVTEHARTHGPRTKRFVYSLHLFFPYMISLNAADANDVTPLTLSAMFIISVLFTMLTGRGSNATTGATNYSPKHNFIIILSNIRSPHILPYT